jgi:hypothetical protein
MSAMTQITASEFNHYQPETPCIPRKQLWTGRVLSGVASAFFLMDGAMKLAKPAAVVQATLQLGFPESTILGIRYRPACLHGPVPNSPYRPLGCSLAHRVLGRSCREQRPREHAVVQHPLPCFLWLRRLGRSLSSRQTLKIDFCAIAILRRDISETEQVLSHCRRK